MARLWVGMAVLLAVIAAITAWGLSSSQSRSRARMIGQANSEGALTIWSVTDAKRVPALLDGFRKLYPEISVNYVDLPAQELYRRFVADADAGRGTADFLWSSAMDLQIKLVNDGYSQPYVSPEIANLPEWAVWKNEAWGTSAEPIVFVYNRSLMSAYPKLPGTHPDLARFLLKNSESMHGKIATYDPAASAVGYLYLAQDNQSNRNTWTLVSSMGRAGVRLYPRTETILEEVAAGRLALAYNMIGSYALEAQARNPQIGVIEPRDYTLVMSRIAMIPKAARHPSAAKLFLDYLLSRDGQQHLAAQYMTPVRTDLPLPSSLGVRSGSSRAIRVGPNLLVHQDQLTRVKFLRDWSRAIVAN